MIRRVLPSPLLSACLFLAWLMLNESASVGHLLLAALMGVLIPMTLMKMGRDPAMGASVMITAMTDSGGFFIFLGLATIFLI